MTCFFTVIRVSLSGVEFKWKLYWCGFALLLTANVITWFVFPLHRVKTESVFRGVPEGFMFDVKSGYPKDYYLYYVNGKAYTCNRGILFTADTGDKGTVIYNAQKPWQSYHYSLLNFWVLVSVPFIFIHFIWFAFILKVYDPLMAPVFPRVKKTISIDAYQGSPKMMKTRQLPGQRRD